MLLSLIECSSFLWKQKNGVVWLLIINILYKEGRELIFYLAVSVLSCSTWDLHCLVWDLSLWSADSQFCCVAQLLWHVGLVALQHVGS